MVCADASVLTFASRERSRRAKRTLVRSSHSRDVGGNFGSNLISGGIGATGAAVVAAVLDLKVFDIPDELVQAGRRLAVLLARRMRIRVGGSAALM